MLKLFSNNPHKISNRCLVTNYELHTRSEYIQQYKVCRVRVKMQIHNHSSDIKIYFQNLADNDEKCDMLAYLLAPWAKKENNFEHFENFVTMLMPKKHSAGHKHRIRKVIKLSHI